MVAAKPKKHSKDTKVAIMVKLSPELASITGTERCERTKVSRYLWDYIKEKKIDLVVNIPKNLSKDELNNDYTIRRSAIDFNIPLITNARLASAFITAFCRLAPDEIQIKSWNEY